MQLKQRFTWNHVGSNAGTSFFAIVENGRHVGTADAVGGVFELHHSGYRLGTFGTPEECNKALARWIDMGGSKKK